MDDHGLASLELDQILEALPAESGDARPELLAWAHRRAVELLHGLAPDDELRRILEGAAPIHGGSTPQPRSWAFLPRPRRVEGDSAAVLLPEHVSAPEPVRETTLVAAEREAVDAIELIDDDELELLLDEDLDEGDEARTALEQVEHEGDVHEREAEDHADERPEDERSLEAAESGVNPYTIDLSDLD